MAACPLFFISMKESIIINTLLDGLATQQTLTNMLLVCEQ